MRSREEIETELQRHLTKGVRGPNAAWAIVHKFYDEVRNKAVADHIEASDDMNNNIKRGQTVSNKEMVRLYLGAPCGLLKTMNIRSSSMSLSYDANEVRLLSYAEVIAKRSCKTGAVDLVEPDRSSVTTQKHVSLLKAAIESWDEVNE